MVKLVFSIKDAFANLFFVESGVVELLVFLWLVIGFVAKKPISLVESREAFPPDSKLRIPGTMLSLACVIALTS